MWSFEKHVIRLLPSGLDESFVVELELSQLITHRSLKLETLTIKVGKLKKKPI